MYNFQQSNETETCARPVRKTARASKKVQRHSRAKLPRWVWLAPTLGVIMLGLGWIFQFGSYVFNPAFGTVDANLNQAKIVLGARPTGQSAQGVDLYNVYLPTLKHSFNELKTENGWWGTGENWDSTSANATRFVTVARSHTELFEIAKVLARTPPEPARVGVGSEPLMLLVHLILDRSKVREDTGDLTGAMADLETGFALVEWSNYESTLKAHLLRTALASSLYLAPRLDSQNLTKLIARTDRLTTVDAVQELREITSNMKDNLSPQIALGGAIAHRDRLGVLHNDVFGPSETNFWLSNCKAFMAASPNSIDRMRAVEKLRSQNKSLYVNEVSDFLIGQVRFACSQESESKERKALTLFALRWLKTRGKPDPSGLKDDFTGEAVEFKSFEGGWQIGTNSQLSWSPTVSVLYRDGKLTFQS